jgi:hypothetical protein
MWAAIAEEFARNASRLYAATWSRSSLLAAVSMHRIEADIINITYHHF